MSYTYKYPRPALTVDCVVFGYSSSNANLQVLLIQRGIEPYKGAWALPGGFVNMDEDLETAAKRELQEETGVCNVFLEQLFTFSAPQRDPRGRVVSVAYYALIPLDSVQPKAADDADNVAWYNVNKLPPLAFDHSLIMDTALRRLRAKVRYQPIGFELLPPKFPLSALRILYQSILNLDKPLEKRNFRKKILKLGILNPLDEYQQGVAHRAARLYSFDKQKYEQLQKREAVLSFDLF